MSGPETSNCNPQLSHGSGGTQATQYLWILTEIPLLQSAVIVKFVFLPLHYIIITITVARNGLLTTKHFILFNTFCLTMKSAQRSGKDQIM